MGWLVALLRVASTSAAEVGITNYGWDLVSGQRTCGEHALRVRLRGYLQYV